MHKTFATLAAAALLTIAAHAQTQPTAELLQKAIYAQEVSGDFDAAVKIYHQIVDSHPTQRELGAQAQYRLGMTLLQQGDATAASQEIQRLGWDYPDFKDLIASANKPAVGQNRTLIFQNFEFARSNLERGYSQTIADHERLFDFGGTVTVTGTVSQIALINPYSWLTVNPLTINVSGMTHGEIQGPVRISLASPKTLEQATGWTRDTLKLGQTVTVIGAPAIDGSATLQAVSISLNGKTLFARPSVAMSTTAVKAYEQK